VVTQAFAALGPVIDQTTQRVPLTLWSLAAFAGIIAACAYLAYRRSSWVVFVLALVIPFAAYRDVGQTTLTIPKMVTLGTALGLLLSGIHPWPRSTSARRILVVGAVLLAAIVLSAISASDRWEVAREFFKQAEYLVLAWCAIASIENITGAVRALVSGVAVATGVVASFALWQAFAGGAPSAVLVHGYALPRVASTLEGPNQLAGYLEAALPMLWVMPLIGAGLAPLRSYVVGASAAALILSQSRAGIIMAAVAYAVLAKVNRSAARTSGIASACGAALGVAVLGLWFVRAHATWADLERFFLLDVSADAGGVGTRAQLWPAAIAMFAHHPITGVGAGNFSSLLPAFGVQGVATQASSLWLQTLAEQGLVGLAALVLFAVYALRETWRSRTQSALALAAFLATVSLLTHQLVDDLFFYPKVAGLFWLLLGAGVAAQIAEAGKGASTPES
jgi:putative inorganic carbon (hco3(-)) transporter